uniref:Kinase n=1 Tax=Clastoptera arizonana TaxID=38151 RepID=A0A1B6CX26_9HEMI
MVYLLPNWGMGESQLHNQINFNQQLHTADLLSQLSSDRCKDQDDDEVSLLPLNNQVGGHTRLMLLDQLTICKPLNHKELEFYENIPHDIQMFVPKYKGTFKSSLLLAKLDQIH